MSITNRDRARHNLLFSSHPCHNPSRNDEVYDNLLQCPLSPVLNHHPAEAIDLDYPLKDCYRPVYIVGSCNGLVCVSTYQLYVGSDGELGSVELFLWNPATKKSVELPKSNASHDERWAYSYYGYGHCASTNDYKVAGVFIDGYGYGYGKNVVVEVYSLRTGHWKRIKNICPGYLPSDSPFTSVNGKFHWTTHRRVSSGLKSSQMIVSLDMITESYSEIPLPPILDEDDSRMTSGALGENFCVLCDYRGRHADIWIMKEYGVRESWNKLASIPYYKDPSCKRYSIPLSVSNTGEILMGLAGDLVLYDTKTNSFKHPKVHDLGPCWRVTTYIESLVSPFVDNGAPLKTTRQKGRKLFW